MDNLVISGIFVYPIKSLAGIALSEAKVQSRGLEYDRRWVLVNNNNLFIHQRDHHQMALLQPEISGGQMVVRNKLDAKDSITIPLNPEFSKREQVTVWDDTCPAVEVSIAANSWFSKKIGINCRLMYMPDDSVRPTDPRYSIHPDNKVSFADGYPIHIISEASVSDLNHRINSETIPAGRFRPNIILSGGHPYCEDELKVFEMNEATFYGVKPCARCVMTTVDTETAQVGKEPLKTLATYRKQGNRILFGQNIIPTSDVSIKVGDTLEVKERLNPIIF